MLRTRCAILPSGATLFGRQQDAAVITQLESRPRVPNRWVVAQRYQFAAATWRRLRGGRYDAKLAAMAAFAAAAIWRAATVRV